ncbi:MAG: DUF4387 family protein [Novosphingobium sp.]
MSARTLRNCADFVRSKNSGPFTVTIDIFFPDTALLDAAWTCEGLSKAAVADLYKVPQSSIRRFRVDLVKALKISLPRRIPAGEIGDTDVAGGQQFAPLLDIMVP